MKKIILFFICTFCFMNIYNAECTYTEQKNLGILAGYVDKSYSYEEGTGKFTLKLLNVPDKLKIQLDRGSFASYNNEVSIPGFNAGETISIRVMGSENSECDDLALLSMNFSFPYINNYYGSEECVGHESLDACSHRFLNYQLSENTFKKLIQEDFKKTIEEENNKNKEENNDKETPSFWDNVLHYFKIIGIPALLIIVSSGITISIFSVIYRKIKHGL